MERFRLGMKALMVLKDEPGNPDYARLLHLSMDEATYTRLSASLRSSEDGQRLLDEGRTVPGEGVSLDTLAELPEGTLGHAFAGYFQKNNISPFVYEYPLEKEGHFLLKRYRETHDIHHIVTGYAIDEIGECELQAFYYGNLGLRHAGFIAFASFPALFTYPPNGLRDVVPFARRIWAAYKRGQRCPMILGVPFDEMWALPISEIQQRIGLADR